MRILKKSEVFSRLVAVTMAAALLTLALPAAAANVTIKDSPVPLGQSVVYTPQTGSQQESGGGATLDYSNCSEGYVMARYSGGGKIKVQITRQGGKTYTYDLRSDGQFEVFPLTGGDGTYSIGIFQNVSGSQYAQALSTSIGVQLNNGMLPFLYPSQYVNFNANSKTVSAGVEITKNVSDQLGIVSAVYNYVIQNISYDTVKAQNVRSGYLPDVDAILASRKGICFDYAAVMATMLRSQGIPTRLEVGYVSGGAYHAWISTYITSVGWVNNIIQFDGKSWKLMDPTFASSGGSSPQIMQYIGNGQNYSVQYLY